MAKTVAVYSITGGTRALIEADGLGSALRRASSSVGQVHVVLCGCGSRQAEQLLLGELAGADVRLETFGCSDRKRCHGHCQLRMFFCSSADTFRAGAEAR